MSCTDNKKTPAMSRSFFNAQRGLACLVIVALAGTAHAQNALGDGSALDANTGQAGSRNYERPTLASELSFRNAIATGNAPGGLSFRGDLGYRAAGEFTGSLGSDSLFSFRRDSLYSGLAGMGIRGTDAIQYQFALTTGASLPQNLMGNLSVSRENYSGSNTFGGQQSNQVQGIAIDREASDLDPTGRRLSTSFNGPQDSSIISGFDSGSMLGTLRSSSTYTTTSTLQPSLLSVYGEGVDRRQIGLIASPLLGITSTPMARDEDKAVNPLVARPSGSDNSNQNNGISTQPLTTSYDGIVAQMREHVEELRTKSGLDGETSIRVDETNDSWLIRQMQDIREKLYGVKPANDQAGEDSDQDPSTNPDANDPSSTDPSSEKPNPLITNPDSPASKAMEEALKSANMNPRQIELHDPTQLAIDPETLEVLRGAAAKEIDKLLDPNASQRDIYSEHILAGQRLMNDGRFFDAEERFTHALSMKPDDIPSQLGRFHSQIGAGMVLSASVNLQSLFSMHPEIIASKYTGDLLPDQARIDSLLARLKERAGITQPKHSVRLMESDRVRVSASILMAYLGYQIDDQSVISQGLDVAHERGDETDRRFVSLLRQIWIVSEDSDQSGNSKADHPG